MKNEHVGATLVVAQNSIKQTMNNNNKHQRKSIRLKGYDYSQKGLYFITITCQDRLQLFGEIEDGEMVLNDAGKMIESEWLNLPQRFHNIEPYEYIVMPNHFHAILQIIAQIKGQPQGIAPTSIKPTLGDIIGAFKSISTNEYIRGVKNKNWIAFNKKLWQRNYYEHIIRNEKSFDSISKYITNNPMNWDNDEFNF